MFSKKIIRLTHFLFIGTMLTPQAFADGMMSFGGDLPKNVKISSNVQKTPPVANPYSDLSVSDDAPIIRPGTPDIRPEKGVGPQGMDFFGNERGSEEKKRSLGTAKQYVLATPIGTTKAEAPKIESVTDIQNRVNKTARDEAQKSRTADPFSNQGGSQPSPFDTLGQPSQNQTDTNQSDDDTITLQKDTQKSNLMDQARNPHQALENTKENRLLLKALKREFPSSDVIHEIRKEGFRAVGEEVSPFTTQKPVKRTIAISMDPGSEIPTIHLAYGIETPITFNDISGQPWEINYTISDKDSYDIQVYEQEYETGKTQTDKYGNKTAETKRSATNTLVIVPKQQGAISGRNLVVLLKGAKTPVNFMLDQGKGDTYDAQVYASVAGRGPNAREDYVQDMIAPSNDSEMQAFIDGTPPKGAHKRKTDNPAVEAWTYNHLLYVRTSGEVFAPGPQKRATSSLYGVTVFAVADSPAITVSFDGELSVVRID